MTAPSLLSVSEQLSALRMAEEPVHPPRDTPSWPSPTTMPQAPTTPLIATEDPPLDTPFLHAMGVIKRPSSFSFRPAHDDNSSSLDCSPVNGTSLGPIRTSSSFCVGTGSSLGGFPLFSACAGPALGADLRQPSTVGSSVGSRRSFDMPQQPSACAPTAAQDGSSGAKRQHTPAWAAGHFKGGLSCSSMHGAAAGQAAACQHSGLASINSAPAGPDMRAGDLRDQGRTSCAGAGGWGAGASATPAAEEVYTPMQAMSADCINDLLGSLGTSLFCDSLPATPASRRAAAAAAKQGPIFPDAVEAWEDLLSKTPPNPARPQGAARAASSNGSGIRRDSSSGGSAFASAGAAAAAAAVAAAMCLTAPQPKLLQAFDNPNPYGYPHPLATSFSTPAPRFGGTGSASSMPAAAMDPSTLLQAQQQGVWDHAAAAAAAAVAQGFGYGSAAFPQANRLQRTSSVGGAAPAGFQAAPHHMQAAYSTPYAAAAADYAAAALQGPFGAAYAGPHHRMALLQGVSSVPVGMAAPYSSPAALAAVMQAYCNSSALQVPSAAAAAGGLYHADANLTNQGSSFNGSHSGSLDAARGSNGAWQSGPPGARNLHMAPSGGPHPLHSSSSLPGGTGAFHRMAPRRFGGSSSSGSGSPGSTNSKADPRSLCGVDPRLCVGSPADVEFEVCRRNPGLAELLRLPPRSVRLVNVPVRPDPSPPELLASKRPDGPITPEELTIESGLLRHCFGLPSSIGPDLVRAARHAVSRDNGADAPIDGSFSSPAGAPRSGSPTQSPSSAAQQSGNAGGGGSGCGGGGGGLEPFFWVLQAKLAWLLKRPVFFKGQLLRGEIHAITDTQRAQSFAQVTEQRAKLGELLLVLYAMLQPAAGPAEGEVEQGASSKGPA